MVKVIERINEPVLNRISNDYISIRRLPFRLTADIYKGCAHRCGYCYGQVYDTVPEESIIIEVKVDAGDVLEKEIRCLNKREVIIPSPEPYQPVEEKYEIMRDCLKVLYENEWPCLIETKSDLIVRDIDLIKKVNDNSFAAVSTSITCLDEAAQRILEPNSPSPEKRFEAMRTFSEEGITTFIHISPFLPYITENNLEEIIKKSADIGADYVVIQPLVISEWIWEKLRKPLREVSPSLEEKYQKLYFQDGKLRYYIPKTYQNKIEKKVAKLIKKYGIKLNAPIFPRLNNAEFKEMNRWRYPVLTDYFKYIREKNGKNLNLEEILTMHKYFPVVDKQFESDFKQYWQDGSLFQGVTGLERIVDDDKIFYRYTGDVK